MKCFSNIKYNQKLVNNYSCTGQAACWVISDATGLRQDVLDPTAHNWTFLPLSFRKKVWERQLETGATEGFGDSLKNWMVQAIKLFNEEFPELPYTFKIVRIRDLKNVDVLKAVLKESSIHTGYTWKLLGDAQDNWVIDEPNNVDWGGHSIRIVKIFTEKDNSVTIKYCDNYEGAHKFNIITVPNFEDNKDFFSGGYYITKVLKV